MARPKKDGAATASKYTSTNCFCKVRKARSFDSGRKFDIRCAVQSVLLFNLFIDLYGYIYFSS